jgi:hypothetical protein
VQRQRQYDFDVALEDEDLNELTDMSDTFHPNAPWHSLSMQHDDQIKPNYIPRDRGHGQGQGDDDYISRYESTDEVRENNRRSKNKSITSSLVLFCNCN